MGAFLAGTGSVMVKDGMDGGGEMVGGGHLLHDDRRCHNTESVVARTLLCLDNILWTVCFQVESSQSKICIVGLSATILCPHIFLTDTWLCADNIL